MENRDWMPYDEAAALGALDLEYIHIPMEEWTPEVVDSFARALADHEGSAILHCAVAWRASLVWASYLVRHRAMDLNQAMEQAGTIYPLHWPLEGLLGRDVDLRIKH
jgi:protein tyrosine phosphatase (PTP) superfamily phosphohydrolase (DUF442 family)